MENLPFLTKPAEQSRNDPGPQSENEWPQQPPRYIEQQMAPPPRNDVFESLRANPMGLILIGIIVGVIIANMRPVVIQPK
jgi:hypothetical protein